MLTELAIRDFALVDSLRLEFEAGLLAITGETGAGKSLLVNALAFALGERAQTEWIRTGSERCEVAAVFTWPRGGLQLAGELGLDPDEPLILRRELSSAGRSRVWICDRPASVGSLRQLGGRLCDLHGQHQHQWLLDPDTHADYVDAWVDSRVQAAYREAWSDWHRCARALEAAREELSASAQQREFWAYQLKEIERIAPRPGEYDELSRRRERGRHRTQLAELYESVDAELASADDSILPRLAVLHGRLSKHTEFDSRLAAWAQQLQAGLVELEELAQAVTRAAAELDEPDTDPEELEQRLHTLYRLKNKFGGSLENAIAERDLLQERLARLEDSDVTLRDLETAQETAAQSLKASGEKLRRGRARSRKKMLEALSRPLTGLGLRAEAIEIRMEPLPLDDWTLRGPDRVEFLLAANPGEEPRPLARVASGGELSRVMLALKSIMPGRDRVETLVFDEVDAGIGGETATRVGEVLKDLSRGRQILVITHLHQIAARADRHWNVDKELTDGRHVPIVRELDSNERVETLGRLISGGEATRASKAAARALVREARES